MLEVVMNQSVFEKVVVQFIKALEGVEYEIVVCGENKWA